MSIFGSLKQSLEEVMVQKLFEIADRMADQAAKGVLRSQSFTVGTEWFSIIGAWLSCTIYNNGSSDVYLRLGDDLAGRPWELGEAPLKSGESMNIDLVAKTHDPERGRVSSPTIWFICQTGTATMRIFKVM